MNVKVYVNVGVAVYVDVGVAVNVNVGVAVYVAVNVGVSSIIWTKAQSSSPLKSSAQFTIPTKVDVGVGEGTEHGSAPISGSSVPPESSHSTSGTPPRYRTTLVSSW